jgi:methionine biosynthesis protein MetW
MISTPDAYANGLTAGVVDPLRYNSDNSDPEEAPGILRSYMPEGVKVLDVGCSTGSVTSTMNEGKGNQVFGVEPDDARATVARSRGYDVQTGYLSQDYVRDHGPFDVIVFADVLEHVADPSALLSLALSALKNGGLLLVSVPNVAHWTLRVDLLKGRFIYMPYGIRDATHLRWFTRETLENLLRAHGLVIEEFRNSCGLWMQEYEFRRPWKWLGPSRRKNTIRRLVRRYPLLFGCQHVVKARYAAL